MRENQTDFCNSDTATEVRVVPEPPRICCKGNKIDTPTTYFNWLIALVRESADYLLLLLDVVKSLSRLNNVCNTCLTVAYESGGNNLYHCSCSHSSLWMANAYFSFLQLSTRTVLHVPGDKKWTKEAIHQFLFLREKPVFALSPCLARRVARTRGSVSVTQQVGQKKQSVFIGFVEQRYNLANWPRGCHCLAVSWIYDGKRETCLICSGTRLRQD